MSISIYGDFSRPCCFLASRRVDALRARGVRVDRRAVERCPQLPLAGVRPAGADDRLAAELADATALLVAGENW